MKTIAETMKKQQSANSMRSIAHAELNRLEQRLIYAHDFCPSKVEYYKQLIVNHKSAFSKYLN